MTGSEFLALPLDDENQQLLKPNEDVYGGSLVLDALFHLGRRRMPSSMQETKDLLDVSGQITKNLETFTPPVVGSFNLESLFGQLPNQPASSSLLWEQQASSTPRDILTGAAADAPLVGTALSDNRAAFELAASAPQTAPLPDLVGTITPGNIPSTIVPGDQLKVSINISNLGSVRAKGQLEINFYASTDPFLDTLDSLLGSLVDPAHKLKPSESQLHTASLIVPSAPPGNYYLMAAIDPNNTIAESNESNNQALSNNAQKLEWKFGSFENRSHVPLTIRDSNGTPMTLEIKGQGTGTIDAQRERIVITGTDANSTLSITTTPGQETAIKDIVVDGSLKALDAPNTDLLGSLSVTGTLGSLVLDDVVGTEQHTLTLGNALKTASVPSELLFDKVKNLSINSSYALEKIRATQWLDTNATADFLTAPTLGKLRITGDPSRGIRGNFGADLLLSGRAMREPAKPLTLGMAKINGTIEGSTWNITGDVGIVITGAMNSDSSVDLLGDLLCVEVSEDLSGTIAARHMPLIMVGKDVKFARILAGASLGSDGVVGGSGNAADTFGAGNIGALLVGGEVISSVVGAGLDPIDGIFNNGNDNLVGGVDSAISLLNVEGNASADSLFAAGSFSKLVRINKAWINPEIDPRFLTLNKVNRDTTPPIITAALVNDTGASNQDGITHDPTISGTIIDSSGIASVRAGFGNTPVSSFVDITNALTATKGFILNRTQLEQIAGTGLVDNPYTLHMEASDAHGNVSSVKDITFTLDPTAPTAPSAALLAASDSGASNSDKITNVATPTITGMAGAGEVIQLSSDGQLVGQTIAKADGTWQLNTNPLLDGVHALGATSIDVAGNVSASSTPLVLKIDTVAPVLTLTTPIDNASLTQQARLTGRVDDTGTSVTALSYHFDDSAPVPVSVDAVGAFDQQIDFTGISNGEHTLTLTTIDTAGNVLTDRKRVQVNLDTAPPAISAALVADTAAGEVTNTDGTTSNPTISGKVSDASAIVEFKASFHNNPAENSSSVLANLLADGSFIFDRTQLERIAGGTLTDGAYMLHLWAKDIHGNTSDWFDLAFTLDTTAPAPTSLDLQASSDSGTSDSDNITNDGTPTIFGTAEAGAGVQLSSNGKRVGTATATAANTWEITTNQLEDGSQVLTATTTDVAGNVSTASAPLDVVIDTTAPTAPTDLRLTPDTDTGNSNSDNITSNTTPIIQGKGEAGARVQLFEGEQLFGSATATLNGDWQLTVETLNNGQHTFTTKSVDVAGNVSFSSGQLVVTIEAAATDNSVTQAIAQINGLDPYPDAVTLVPGTTRQLSLKLNGLPDSPELTADPTLTQYKVSNPEVVSVSSDGLVRAIQSGTATITVSYGESEVEIPVLVAAPQTGAVTLGVDGGVVQADSGATVAIAPGALDENTTVSLTPLSQENLSLPVPEGFKVAGAFDLNFNVDQLSVPAQLSIPAPASLPVGTQVYFMRKGSLPDETGTWNPIWLQEESGVVGADGMIRTSSPPYPGVLRPGEYMVAYDSPTGSATLVKGKLQLNYNFPLAFFGIIIPGKKPGNNFGQLLNPDYFVTTPAFSVTYDISSVKVIAIPTVGLPVVTTVGVQRNDDGIATFEANLQMPSLAESDPIAPPVLQKAELKFKDENNQSFPNNEPVLFLTGSNVLLNNSGSSLGSKFDDLNVEFHVGSQVTQGTVIPGLSKVLPDNQFDVAVKVPNTVPLGVSHITLSRRQNELVGENRTAPTYEEVLYSSNEVRLEPESEYVFSVLRGADTVAVMDSTNPESVVEATSSNDLLLARIPIGTADREDRPRSLAVTQDGSRVYVPLEGSSRVALVDPMVLQQVDTQPLSAGLNPIDLPAGAAPRSIVIDSRDDYAYIADGSKGSIYVLDINPFSQTYHQVIQTIAVSPAPLGLRQMAISSDGRKLFVAAPASSTSQILAINIDPQDQPRDNSQNDRKWHQQIGAVAASSSAEGVEATSNPRLLTFTNSRSDAKGFGVLEITNDDPLNFAATTRYVPLGLGSIYDYFDVNEGIAIALMHNGDYAFVVGRNATNFGSGVESIDGVQAGSNIGIIKDPLGANPQLVAATRPIPKGYTTDLVLDNDNKYLYASYPTLSGGGGVYVFDVEEMINTLNNPGNYVIDSLDRGTGSPFFQTQSQHPATVNDLKRVPIDDINPLISIAADYEILKEDRPRNQFTYGVPSDTTRGPIATSGSPWGMAVSPGNWLELSAPIGTSENSGTPGSTPSSNPLTPTFQWKFDDGIDPKDVDEVNLFVSVFDEGEGLLPDDEWEALKDINNQEFLKLTPQQQQDLLSKPRDGYIDDHNPNRILTARWSRNPDTGEGEWSWGDGTRSAVGINTTFTLTPELTLTAGQQYNWAVEAWSKDGKQNVDSGEFWTPLPPAPNGEGTFRSVSILTHGFKPPLFSKPGIPQEFYALADSIANAGFDSNGLLLKYDRLTGYWIPINKYGQVIEDFPPGLNPASDPEYLQKLKNYINPYLQSQAPLVLLNDWSMDNESVVPDSGFTEAAADAFFTSLVQLDQVFKDEDSTTEQGAILNSPLHFIGFSRGSVVNSEIIQRLGIYYPEAGGKEKSGGRDLQMTTLDPHDFNQPSLNLVTQNFGDFREPKVQVWENVTFADNYYQTVPDLEGRTITPAGRDIPNLPPTEAEAQRIATGLRFPRLFWRAENPNPNAPLLGQPDLSVFLGTNQDHPNEYRFSRAGFTKETDPGFTFGGRGATHGRVMTWYAGTTDLFPTHFPFSEDSDSNAIFRRRGDGHYGHLFDRSFSFGSSVSQPPRVSPWYTPEHKQASFVHGADNAPTEGIGTGWFYSALGGGKDLRPQTSVAKIPLDFDNTYDSHMRGDYPVPTLFNGNFDAEFNPQGRNRTFWSNAIPGWSFHNGGQLASVSSSDLVNVNQLSASVAPALNAELDRIGVDRTQPNYALKLDSGDSITHNRFVVPEWGTLRFDLHVPELSANGKVKIYIKGDAPNAQYQLLETVDDGTIDLRVADGRINPGATPEIAYPLGYTDTDTYRIGYGTQGFETFHVDIPEALRGKTATLKIEVSDGAVYLDDVFFKSENLLLGNPTLNGQEARPDSTNYANNYLIEKPQYSLSYNDSIKGPNWVSWQLNKSWLGNVTRPGTGTAPPGYPPADFPDGTYPASQVDYPWLGDNDLPDGWMRTEGPDYRLNERGMERGHMVPVADRDRTSKDVYSTFLTSNMLPQHGDGNNRGVWKNFERDIRASIEDSTSTAREYYIIAGGYGYDPNRAIGNRVSVRADGRTVLDPNGSWTVNPKGILIPEFTWKILVPLQLDQGFGNITTETEVVAIMVPNRDSLATPRNYPLPGETNRTITNWNEWRDWRVSVDYLEDLTGYNFLSKLPEDIQEVIESRNDGTLPG